MRWNTSNYDARHDTRVMGMSDTAYAFADMPLNEIRAGSTVLVTGPPHGGARELALRMVAGKPGEGAILVTTNQRSRRVVEDCRRMGLEIAADETAILDCVGETEQNVPARVLSLSGPADLTGIGMRFSDVHREFERAGLDSVRTGLYSLSTLLTFSDVRTVSRFVHALVGRIDAVDGLGILLIDPTNHDTRTVSTLSQFCTGRIEVQDTDDGPELRARGLGDQPRSWTAFDPTTE